MAAPVVFLDIDGVVHPLGSNYLPLYASKDALMERADRELSMSEADLETHTSEVVKGEFIPPCMRALAEALEASGAAVVLSSTWRETGHQRRCVAAALTSYGIAEPIGSTTSLPSYEGGREREITRWVEEHPEVPAWVAIDDLDLALPEAHFVRTDRSRGFTAADGVRVRATLLAQMKRASWDRRRGAGPR